MLDDFEKIEIAGDFQTDICIVGSGVAGLTLASEFLDSGLKVLILEGGGKKDESKSQQIYRSKVVGIEHDGIHNGRFRVFGGSSTRWGGQLMTYRKEDFEKKPYIPDSGWPLKYQDIEPYYPRAESVMKVNSYSYEDEFWNQMSVQPLPLDKKRFTYRFSKWADFKNRNLAKSIGISCRQSNNISVLLHANAIEVCLQEKKDHVSHIKIKSFSGKEATVKAKIFIICMGTIETARLLLASKSTSQNGVGNDHDLVGRYFQDHISYRAARLNPKSSKLFSETFNPFYRTATMHSCKVDLSAKMQDTLKCSHVMGHIDNQYSEESGFYELRRILRALQSKKNPLPSPMGAWRILRYTDDIFRLIVGARLLGRRVSSKDSTFYLQLEAEQVPSKDSRVTLDDKCDALGMPCTILDWKLSGIEKRSMRKYVELFKEEWDRLDMGESSWDEKLFKNDDTWLSGCTDTFHQTGTTRMSENPEQGVVDSTLKVHGIKNLYIASCSVFPTGGTANPTLTMMALCMRMADQIKHNFEIKKDGFQ